nr:MAG TPA: hypothetical protein [Caudoviricetes sp.]
MPHKSTNTFKAPSGAFFILIIQPPLGAFSA